jgi:Mor family transcriptional regulator
MKDDADDYSFLPAIIQELEQLIGLPAALQLVENFPGVKVYVPKGDLPDDHRLCEIVGIANAAKLVQEYAGELLDIPRCLVIMRTKRNTDLRKKYDAGTHSARDLALEYSLTERHVWNILGSPSDEDDRQLTLFE